MQSDVPQNLEQLGPYQLVEKLGEGAAGAVYRAGHDILEREYAIKVVHHQLTANEIFRQRFYRESRLAARLKHPNIVDIITADNDGDYYYLVMEYVEGPSLEKKVRQQPLPTWQAVCYVKQVLAGLEYVHEQGILHRDVKADNVLISDDGTPKLVDFGLVLDVN